MSNSSPEKGPSSYLFLLADTRLLTGPEIDRPLIFGFRQWRLDQEVTPRTINRQVGTIHNMLNKGVEWKRIGWNPIAGIKPLSHDKLKKKRRSLLLAEVQAILDASPEYLKPVWLTYMTTAGPELTLG